MFLSSMLAKQYSPCSIQTAKLADYKLMIDFFVCSYYTRNSRVDAINVHKSIPVRVKSQQDLQAATHTL